MKSRPACLLTANGDHGNLTNAQSPAEAVPRLGYVELSHRQKMMGGTAPDRPSKKKLVTLMHAQKVRNVQKKVI